MPIQYRALADGRDQVLLPDALDRECPNAEEEVLILIHRAAKLLPWTRNDIVLFRLD